MDTKEFLRTVITTDTGYFCLAVGNGTGGWLEQWHKWPEEIDAIVERAVKQSQHSNVYFSSYLFKAPQSTKDNVLPSRTFQADLDNAELNTLPREPTVTVETSPGRHQAYWVLEGPAVDLDYHEQLSKKITYSIENCDRSGWPLGRKVRVPGTKNYKYLTGPKEVQVVGLSGRTYKPEDFDTLPEVNQAVVEHYDDNFIESPESEQKHGLELLDDIKDKIPVSVYVAYNYRQKDRSEALWALMCYGFKAGLSRHQVFRLAKDSANNKFADLKHRADQDLAKDVLRAEHAVNSGLQDPRQVIYDIHKTPISPIERKRQIYNVVLKTLKDQGEFLHARNGYGWYIRRDMGRPIALTRFSEGLQSLLDMQFGLNATEPEQKYVVEGIRSYVTSLPDTAFQSALSYYDPERKHLLVHTGRKTVLRVTSNNIEECVDGAYGVIFPWGQSYDIFTPNYSEPMVDWGSELFGEGERGFGSSVKNLLNMTPEQAMAMLKVWTIFILFRNIAFARPIIASFGQPGSGKTTLFRKIYAVLYGRYKSLNAVTNMEDFDHAAAADPLVVMDNVDTWQSWLPDRIALSAGISDVVKRKLYADFDTITLRRQAMIGVTAHNPRFGREDVADRFLLFNYYRFANFIPDEAIMTDLLSRRDRIWGSILRDCQRVMSTPMPASQEVPQFRIEDFAKFGVWIARAIGCEKPFRSSIGDVISSQQAFSLEEEGMLVTAVLALGRSVDKNNPDGPQFHSASQLWGMMEGCASDWHTFKNTYRNAVALSKKLSAMQNALKKVVHIEQKQDATGIRLWKIVSKDRMDQNGAVNADS